MIEIEKKFQLTPSQKNSLLKEAIFINESKIIDKYYDNNSYTLTSQCKWLRQRNNKFELKISLPNNNKYDIEQYEEINNPDKIKSKLNLNPSISLQESLLANNLVAFVTLTTIRKTYKLSNFTIVIDEVTAPNFQYDVTEIELVVKSSKESDSAIEEIMRLAKEHKLENKPLPGKLVKYIQQENPEQFKIIMKNKNNL